MRVKPNCVKHDYDPEVDFSEVRSSLLDGRLKSATDAELKAKGQVYSCQEGTFLLDFIDADSKELVWRGTAQKVLALYPPQ